MTLRHSRNGFTLIELLIVIAIVAVLAVGVILTLNPADLLRQARDATRSSDLITLNKALALSQSDGGSPLGTSSVLYVSVPDTSPTCANLGLPQAPVGFTYACVTAGNLSNTDGTGWVPVSFASLASGTPLPALPIDPVNSASRYYTYATNGKDWQLGTSYESRKFSGNPASIGSSLAIVPEEWISVPGNPSFGTSAFQVMKYEAKCVNSFSQAPLTAPSTGYGTYANSTLPCNSSNGRYVASTPSGSPIGSISHASAKTYCSAIGAHLLTNEEWMTIARDAAAQDANWSSGITGTGYLYSGHNDNGPATALVAGSDADSYLGTGQSGTSNQRRILTLSNGSVVWDLAGNVSEHVMRDGLSDTLSVINPLPSCPGPGGPGGWKYCQYGSTLSPYIDDYFSTPLATIGPSDSSWNSAQGMGQVYTLGGGAPGGTIFIRGGYWNNVATGGAFTLNLNGVQSTMAVNVGFRCAR